MTMLRNEFADLFGTSMLPMIHKVIQDKYKSKPDMIPMLFNVEGSDRDIEQVTGVTGFGAVPVKTEGSKIAEDKMLQGFSKNFTHVTYALKFATSLEMMEDEKFGQIRKGASSLAKSMHQTRQTVAANHFNNGFDSTVTHGDGIELFATNHPLKGGGTEQNELTTGAALSVTSLRQALEDMEATTDHQGLNIEIKPKILLVPPALKWVAKELLGSPGNPENAHNVLNSLSDEGLTWASWVYLTSSTRWFLVADKDEHELTWFERRAVSVRSWFDEDVDAGQTKIRNRFSSGPGDWPGLFGSNI